MSSIFRTLKSLTAIRYWIVLSALFALLSVCTLCAETDSPPNILIILADDMGYSDLGCYGGEIDTPSLDRLAADGLRFSQFYNTGRCWPSRVALLSGYYPQQLNADPWLKGKARQWSTPISTVLKAKGYRTYHSGKWHLPPYANAVKDGGFDRSYRLDDYDRYFDPQVHFLNGEPLPGVERGSGNYATEAIAEWMLRFLKEHDQEHGHRPFFGYLAFTSPHFPLQAPEETIRKYRGRYADGWDVLRQQRLARQRALGFSYNRLSPREEGIDAPSRLDGTEEALGPVEIYRAVGWDVLTAKQKAYQSSKMEIHAAMVDEMDRAIGRVIDQLREMGALDNTLILFMSDNGASAEILVRGDGHDASAAMGSAASYLCLGPGFANAANTPLRRYKMWTHEGGVRTPMIVHWPEKIQSALKGSVRHDPAHLVDIMPTLLELLEIDESSFRKNPVPFLPGRSFAGLFSEPTPTAHTPIYFSHRGNRALRLGEWKAVSTASDSDRWNLYRIASDHGETRDLAIQHPEKLERMVELWNTMDRQWQRDAELGEELKSTSSREDDE